MSRIGDLLEKNTQPNHAAEDREPPRPLEPEKAEELLRNLPFFAVEDGRLIWAFYLSCNSGQSHVIPYHMVKHVSVNQQAMVIACVHCTVVIEGRNLEVVARHLQQQRLAYVGESEPQRHGIPNTRGKKETEIEVIWFEGLPTTPVKPTLH